MCVCVCVCVCAGCCLCIHGSAAGPTVSTECSPPLAAQCACQPILCQLGSPSPCLPHFVVICHHTASLTHTDARSHTHADERDGISRNTCASALQILPRTCALITAHALTYACQCTPRFLGHVRLHIHTLICSTCMLTCTPRDKQHYICTDTGSLPLPHELMCAICP